GTTPPLRTLSGDLTGLNHGVEAPAGLILDTVHDELFVTNFARQSVTVYSRGASGNTPPLRTIGGAATQIGGPVGLALDLSNDELFVVSPGGSRVAVFSRTARGNAPPIRTLMGGATGLKGPQGAVLDLAQNELYVPNA